MRISDLKMEATLQNTLSSQFSSLNYAFINLLSITAKPESKKPACCDSITAEDDPNQQLDNCHSHD